MLKPLEGYNWMQVFGAASCGSDNACDYDGATIYNPGSPSTVPGEPDGISIAQFTREDVTTIIAIEERDDGEWDGSCVVILKDGRFAHLEGGCDYTGWDCQSGCSCVVSADFERLIKFGVTDDHRTRLAEQLEIYRASKST